MAGLREKLLLSASPAFLRRISRVCVVWNSYSLNFTARDDRVVYPGSKSGVTLIYFNGDVKISLSSPGSTSGPGLSSGVTFTQFYRKVKTTLSSRAVKFKL